MASATISKGGTKIEFTPLGNQVCFTPHRHDETVGGVLLPESAQSPMSNVKQTPSGTVIAVGPDCKVVKVRDIIIAPSGAPVVPCKRGNAEWFMINEDEILGVVKDIK